MKRCPVTTALLLAACALAPLLALSTARADDTPANASAGQTDDRAANLASKTYRLHPTDKIHVSVPDDPKAERIVAIDMDGKVRLAYLDEPLKLSGLSVNDAIALIQKTYVEQQIFIKPQVTIEVLTYADRRISVNGQVNRPGWVTIPPEETMTLVSSISAAGGPTRLSDKDVTITRTLATGEKKIIHADLKAAMKDPSKDMPIEDGDSIYVPEDMLGSVF